ncbi:MAG: CoA transferase, partial [Chloroflexi bacterium]|nr:CoA transferase [Chloroflexota bacterium]
MALPVTSEALDDVRVLDLSEGVAGPFCTKLLAALGADVITVEAPGRGDRARSAPPFAGDEPHPELSGLFLYLNTGKRSVTLDLAQASGRAIAARLAAEWADIVIEDFAPGQLDAWGLGYEALAAAPPAARAGVIVVAGSGNGARGPDRGWPGAALAMGAHG